MLTSYSDTAANYSGLSLVLNWLAEELRLVIVIVITFFSGVVSGAILQLRAEFHLDCTQQEMVVSSMLMGAVLASLIGGNINCYEV